MFQKLKINSAKKIVDNHLLQHQPQSVSKINNLGIIVDELLLNQGLDLTRLKKEFLFIAEECHILVFSEQEHTEVAYFKKQDLGWKGVFKANSEADKFIKRKYDVLVNYFDIKVPEPFILSALTSAKIKVGFASTEKRINDLTIAVNPTEITLFIKELKKYLAIINQK